MPKFGYLVSSKDLKWQALLQRVPHDVYHTPGYAEVCAREHNRRRSVTVQPMAFIWDHTDCAAIIPLLVSPVPGEVQELFDYPVYDAVSPNGYSGPITSSPGTTEQQILHSFKVNAADQGLLSCFLRAHPTLASSFRWFDGDESEVVGGTLGISCGRDVEAILSSYRSTFRRDVKRLLKSDKLVTEFGRWDLLPAFAASYLRNMARLQAAESYLFDVPYFEDLARSCAQYVELLTVSEGSRFLGGVLLFHCRGVVQYHLPACEDEGRDLGLNRLLIHKMVEYAISKQASLVHLGGGVGGSEDSLAYFKRGFSDKEFPYRCYKIVLDQAGYSRACNGVGQSGHTTFFPRYRNK
jgi:hypothetical protein